MQICSVPSNCFKIFCKVKSGPSHGTVFWAIWEVLGVGPRRCSERMCARESAIEIGKKLISLDNGRLKLADWLMDDSVGFPGLDIDQVAGHHHMGTTRMADGAERGLVDANCKVFGMENLFIASSSVFPTSGHANPTLTIAQMSLRLADHLRDRELVGALDVRRTL